MRGNKEDLTDNGPDIFISICHLVMVLFGIAAWLTGDAADDYKKFDHLWFSVHSWIGIGFACSICLYVFYGTIGPRNARFSRWIPYSKERLQLVREDIAGLMKFKLPDRESHQGLAGFAQFFGLLIFSWIALTGTLMFFLLEPGSKVKGLLHLIKEVHEVGEILIPVYLTIHIGAVLLHSFTGHHVWRKIFFFKDKELRSK